VAEADAPFGGGVLLADASAWQRNHHPAVRDQWRAAMATGQIATCSLIRLELLFSTRNAEEFERAESDHALLRDVPVTSSVHARPWGQCASSLGERRCITVCRSRTC
jgi:predicted nucleic acid-binding protein